MNDSVPNSSDLDSLTINSKKLGLHGFPKNTEEQSKLTEAADKFRKQFKSEILAACNVTKTTDYLKMFLSENLEELAWEEGAVLLGFVSATHLGNIERINQLITEIAGGLTDNEPRLNQEQISKILKIILKENLTRVKKNKFLEIKQETRTFNYTDAPSRSQRACWISFKDIEKAFLDSINKNVNLKKKERYLKDLESMIETLREEANLDYLANGLSTTEFTPSTIEEILMDLEYDSGELEDSSGETEDYTNEDYENLRTSAIKKLEAEEIFPPKVDVKAAYHFFIMRVFKIKSTDAIEDVKDDLNSATGKAVLLYNELFSEIGKLQDWLINEFPHMTELHETKERSALDKFKRFDFYKMLTTALGEGQPDLSQKDIEMAQSITYFAFLIFWQEQNKLIHLNRRPDVNREMERKIDENFWDHALGEDLDFTYYRSIDHTKISNKKTHQTPVSKKVSAQSLNPEFLANSPGRRDISIWRNEGPPKTWIAQLLKTVDQHERPENLPDQQRGEAVGSFSMHDLDLNPNKNPEAAEAFHEFLEEFIFEHCKSLGLTEAEQDTSYKDLKAGTFKVMNKAKWDSSKGLPKQAFLAIKGYVSVPVDVNGKIIEDYSKEKHPNVRSIKREFRIVPYDLWHTSVYAKNSAVHHDPYKSKQAARLRKKTMTASEDPNELNLLQTMIELFDEKYNSDKVEIFRDLNSEKTS
jgi:hypothetical protein